MPTASSSTTADQAFFEEELARFGPNALSTSKTHFPGPKLSLSESFEYCKTWATRHYENFSVVSWLLPQKLRPHFYNIYAYCRWSDNLADEVASADESLQLLSAWREEARLCFPHETPTGSATVDNAPPDNATAVENSPHREPAHPVLQALRATAVENQLSAKPFFDLLDAFVQDQSVHRYRSNEDLFDYCQRSANPVGRILLQLAGADTPENCQLSDHVCTGLQIANFCQDVSRDALLDRIYVPLELMQRFDVSEHDILNRSVKPEMKTMLRQWVDDTRSLFQAGRPLIQRVPKWLAIDVELFIRGGEAILDAIQRQDFDVWTKRPTVSKATKLGLLLRAIARRALPLSSSTFVRRENTTGHAE